MADAIWHYSKGGQQFGPVSADQVRQMLSSGQLNAQDMVWRDGIS